jgi:hypothetical protein
MKKLFSTGMAVLTLATACTKKQFSDAYSDPSKISSTTVDRQLAGEMSSSLNYIMYHYYDYFAVYQNTMIPWSQTAVTLNTSGRYIPGIAAINDLWSTYYGVVAQYKEMVRLYNSLSTADQANARMYYIAGTIFYYDFTQKVVDIWGDIPWSEAGLLGTNHGNYQASAAKYDDAATVYTKMMDDLKGFADELNSINVPTSVATILKTQDFLNQGDLSKWKMYCNSLRVKLLTRVSGVASFKARYGSEMAAILGNSTSYPLVSDYTQTISFKVVSITSGVNNGTNTGSSSDFYTGLIGWGQADRANMIMIDSMNNNSDPRLRALFEPGQSASGAYLGLDPSLPSTTQNTVLTGGTIARYNRSTLTQNNYIPGMLVNAAEIDFMIAEYYLSTGSDANAQAAYEAGITQSINYNFWLRSISNDNTAGPLTPLGGTEIADYLASPGVSWTAAGSDAEKLNRIAIQKWINYNVQQPMEAWAEIRRLNLPVLNFVPDNGVQKLPPPRWLYPTNESTYNTTNYQAVQAKDNLTTKIFWDLN